MGASCPELSFDEVRTTRVLREWLRGLRIDEEACPTSTGAVFSVEGGRPGRTVLVRADIDALPVQEATGLPWASELEGVMHACGHDVHAAALVGVAIALSDCAADLPGRYRLVFQPGEEVAAGSKAMLNGGLPDSRRKRGRASTSLVVQPPYAGGLVCGW